MILAFVKSLKYAGAGDFPEYDINRNICIGVNMLSLYVILLNLTSGAIFYFLSKNLFIPLGAYGEAAIVYGIIVLNRKKKHTLANFCFYITISVATFYFTAILGKVSESQLMILFLFGLIYFLFTQKRIRLYCICFNLMLLTAMEINSEFGLIPAAHFSPVVEHVVRWLVYVVVISLTLKIFQLYQKNTQLLIQLYTYSNTIKASLSVEERLNNLKNLLFQHIAHDLRGPYVGVSAQIFYIHQKVMGGQPVTASDTMSLKDSSEEYKEMLDDFLELSKFKDASFNVIDQGPVNIRTEIAKVVSMHKHSSSQRRLKVKTDFSSRLPDIVIGDKLKINRIIHNLLSNAIKFTKVGSTILIRVPYDGNSWTLVITDEGIGMGADKLQQMFQPWVTEKSPTNPEGVGLGLYITKQLVEMLGATISVDSSPVGTTFTVDFPMVKRLVVT